MPTPARQMQRTLDALAEVARRDRMLKNALLASKLALEKAALEGERLLQMIKTNEAA